MATHTLNDALIQVYRRLRDVADTADKQLLTDTEITDLVRQATSRYSLDRPLEVVADLDPDGTRYLALPTAFEEGFSVIRSIEYPINDDPPAYLDPRDVDFYRTPTVLQLRCRWEIPTGADTVRLTYTGRRAFAALAADTTVLDRDFDAVCDLAVGASCDAIAQKYARTHEPLVGASGIAYRDKADVWAARAKRYEARYRDAMGPAIGSATINWDSVPSWWGGVWLNHPRVRR